MKGRVPKLGIEPTTGDFTELVDHQKPRAPLAFRIEADLMKEGGIGNVLKAFLEKVCNTGKTAALDGF